MLRAYLVQRRLRSIVVVVISAAACTEGDSGSEPVGSTAQTGDGSTEESGEASSESSGSGSGGTGSDASTTGGLEYACAQESECRLHSDCCSCVAVHEDEPVAACDASCERNTCETWGVSELLCAHTCHIRLLECDPTLVACDEAPPRCDDGLAPTIEDRCWTGYCVPPVLCRP
jgi:hypothetical protein